MFGMTSVRTHKGTNIKTSWANMCSDTQRDKLTDHIFDFLSFVEETFILDSPGNEDGFNVLLAKIFEEKRKLRVFGHTKGQTEKPSSGDQKNYVLTHKGTTHSTCL